MTNVESYKKIYNSLVESVKAGEITLENAKMVNQAAFDKYVTEGKDCSDEDLLDKASDLVKDKKLPKDLREELMKYVGCDEDKKEDEEDDEAAAEEEAETEESAKEEPAEAETTEESTTEAAPAEKTPTELVNAYLESKKASKKCDKHPDDCDCDECKKAKKEAEEEKKEESVLESLKDVNLLDVVNTYIEAKKCDKADDKKEEKKDDTSEEDKKSEEVSKTLKKLSKKDN